MMPSLRRILAGGLVFLLPCLLLLSACSDDPILGPSDGESEEGGSYSVIKRLAPTDTTTTDSTASPLPSPTPPADNPERF